MTSARCDAVILAVPLPSSQHVPGTIWICGTKWYTQLTAARSAARSTREIWFWFCCVDGATCWPYQASSGIAIAITIYSKFIAARATATVARWAKLALPGLFSGYENRITPYTDADRDVILHTPQDLSPACQARPIPYRKTHSSRTTHAS